MQLNVDTLINAQPDKIWPVISDIEHCADYISGIKAVEIVNKPANGIDGLKWRETREMFGKDAVETMWITESAENSYYQTRAENHGAVYISRMTIEALDNQQSRLSMSFESQVDSWWVKLISKLMMPFIKGSMVKMIEQDLKDIKQQVENCQ